MTTLLNRLDDVAVHNEERWAEILDKGYTVVPFLDDADIQALLQLHAETHAVVPYDFYVSALDPYEKRRRIYEGISAILNPRIERLVSGYRIFLASFVTKRANSTHGKLEPHQDYSLVDQAKDICLNVWVPLCDVDLRNGCMRMVDYSQRFDHISATSMNPSVYSDLIPELEANYLTDLPMKAGEACIFDARVLHATGENGTDKERPAVLFSMVPVNVQPLLYLWTADEPARLEVYEVETDFILHLPARRYPTPEEKVGARFQKYLEYAPTKWTVSELEERLPHARSKTEPAAGEQYVEAVASVPAVAPPARTSLLGRLSGLFSGRRGK